VFLPLLRKTHNSRIVNVGSKAGKLAMRGIGFYSVSKFGIRGFCDFLRSELEPYNINVSIIEPSTYLTQMGDIETTIEKLKATWQETPEKLREDLTETNLKRFTKILKELCKTVNPNVQDVIDAMIHGVTSYHPKSCYSVSSLKFALFFYFLEKLPLDIRAMFINDESLSYAKMFK